MNPSLPLKRQCICDVSMDGRSRYAFFRGFDLSNAEPLLGLSACDQLGLIRRLCITQATDNSEAASLPRDQTGTAASVPSHITKEYADLFQGIGFLKNWPHSIRLKDGVTPCAVATPRRLPFPLIEKVDQELQRMVVEIIEEVTDPTAWVSPMVPVLKQDGSVRMC